MLEILLLGPVEAWAGVARVPLAPLERDLLALLALQPGTTSSTDRIIDGLWGERPPAAPRARVQGLVSTLRRKVGDALVTRQPGYLLDLPAEATDLGRCEDFARRARTGGDAAETAEWLRRALALWRGEALDGVSAPGTDPERARLSELRIGLLERCFETELALGRHTEVVGELAAAVSANPLRERLVLHLMSALYRCSRQADAMRAYQALQERLDEELGAEPCPDLRELRALILRGEPLPGTGMGADGSRSAEGGRIAEDGRADDAARAGTARAADARSGQARSRDPRPEDAARAAVPGPRTSADDGRREAVKAGETATAGRRETGGAANGGAARAGVGTASGEEARAGSGSAVAGHATTHQESDALPSSAQALDEQAPDVRPGSPAAETALPSATPASPPQTNPPQTNPPPASPRPAQTPATSGHFIGRDDDLAALTAALPGPADEPRVLVVTGAGGLGKTALVVRWAHSVAGRFPDGQIFVGLRAAGPAGPPQAGSALGAVLLALGVAPDRLPVSVEERAALYRTLVHAKRVLVVADDVQAVGQLLPLVPPTPGSLIVATSRRKLTALSIHHAVRTLTLEPLVPTAAERVLRAIVGPDRPLGPGTEEVVELCGGWPLALRIAGATLAARSQSPASFAEELRERVDTMAVSGDPRTVREALVDARAGLDPAAARLFGQLGLMPGSSVSLRLAAAAAGVSVLRARQLLDELISANLVVETGPDRYGFHAMVRRYARHCGAGLPDRSVVEERVIRWYLRVFEACAEGRDAGQAAGPGTAVGLPGAAFPGTGPFGRTGALGIVADGPQQRAATPRAQAPTSTTTPTPVSQPRRADPAAIPDAWLPVGDAEIELFLDFERPDLAAVAAWVAGRGDAALTWRFVQGAHSADPLLALQPRLLGLAAAAAVDEPRALGTAHALVGVALLAEPAGREEADRHLTLAAGLLAAAPDGLPVPAAFALGTLRLSQNRGPEAAAALEEALRALDPGRTPLSYAATLLGYARVLKHGGATRRSRDRVAQALVLCEASTGAPAAEPRTAAEAVAVVESALGAPRVGAADRVLARALIAVGRAFVPAGRGGGTGPDAGSELLAEYPGMDGDADADHGGRGLAGAGVPAEQAGPPTQIDPLAAEFGAWLGMQTSALELTCWASPVPHGGPATPAPAGPGPAEPGWSGSVVQPGTVAGHRAVLPRAGREPGRLPPARI